MSASRDTAAVKTVCVRAGCNNPAVESEDWDKEYCSNECVATHCRCVEVKAEVVLFSATCRETFFYMIFSVFQRCI